MRRPAMRLSAQRVIHNTPRIGPLRRSTARQAIEDITDAVVDAWPVSGVYGPVNEHLRVVARTLLKERGYSSIWLMILSSLINLIIQVLIDRFTGEDGRIEYAAD